MEAEAETSRKKKGGSGGGKRGASLSDIHVKLETL